MFFMLVVGVFGGRRHGRRVIMQGKRSIPQHSPAPSHHQDDDDENVDSTGIYHREEVECGESDC